MAACMPEVYHRSGLRQGRYTESNSTQFYRRRCCSFESQLALQVAAIPFDWPTFRRKSAGQLPVYAEADAELASLPLPELRSKGDAPAHVARGTDLVDVGIVEMAVGSVVAAVLGADVAPGAPLVQAGLDSMGRLFFY